MKVTLQQLRNINDDYMNTVFAIVGFMNIYKYELKDNGVKLFQGRKFNRKNEADSYVTPDIGILIKDKDGIVGEVKNSFPADENLWIDDFKQLLKYDDNLIGWPLKGEELPTHDIVLLVHQSRSRRVKDYYISKSTTEIKFSKPFIIVEFNRSDQGKQFFNFRIEHGKLSNNKVQQKLYLGTQVPMDVFVTLYSKIKLYDSKPHLSWMLYLIYLCMIDKCTQEGNYSKLNKRTKISINTSVNEILFLLNETYSFSPLHKNHSDRQIQLPRKEWVKEAVEKLVSLNDAKWNDTTNEKIIFYLKHHDGDVKSHYEERCLEENLDSKQISLAFPE